MDEKVEFDHDPNCKGNIAHEIVNKLQVIDSSMTGQKR